MSKKKGCSKVATRVPRFRQDTPFMRAHESMVDYLKGNVASSVSDFLGAGIFGYLQNLELTEEWDLIYSDEEDDYDDYSNQQNDTEELRPHPRIKELHDEETEEKIKESIEEEEKRKSKSVKNKRKKMRKRERKQRVREKKEEDDKKEEEQDKLSDSEDKCNIIYKEVDKSPREPNNLENNNKIVNEENHFLLIKEINNPLKNLEAIKQTPSLTESSPEKKTKIKSGKNKNAPTTQNKETKKVEVAQHSRKEEPQKEKYIKAEAVSEMNKEEKLDNCEKETLDPIVMEYAKKSKEMADMGNHLAASGQYEMAIKCFTEAIKFTPKEYKIFGNRSFCFERMQLFEEALRDAEVSLSLEPNWVKGLFRKGKALCGLKKYYEASLTFSEVLKMESASQEATMELKRAQTLHLMEMGFTWSQCSNALKNHFTLEEAIEALFKEELASSSLEEYGACWSAESTADQSRVQEDWVKVHPSNKSKQQSVEKVEYPQSKKQARHGTLFPVWVGSLSSTVNYTTLQEVFNRAGNVFNIKMVLEHQCAFVNYTSKADCERAIQLLNGMVLEGRPLSVRYPSKLTPGLGASKDAVTDPCTPPCIQRECFFWRTTGCTKDDCTFMHVAENKGIDQDKFIIKNNI